MQHLSDRLVCHQPHIAQGLVEAGDRPAVHLLVRAVAAMDPHYRRLIAIATGVAGRPAERLGPIRGEPLAVLRMEPMAERVADYLIGHHPAVPRLSQADQALAATGRLIHTSHAPRMPRPQRPAQPYAAEHRPGPWLQLPLTPA